MKANDCSLLRVEDFHCTWFMLHENILEECAEAEDGLGVGGDLVQPEPEPDRGDTRLSVDLIRDRPRKEPSLNLNYHIY